MMKSFETATLAGGCFWCTEAVFKRLRGKEFIPAILPDRDRSENIEIIQRVQKPNNR